MAALKLIACDVLVGLPRKPYPLFRPDAADLDRELDRLEISGAIVRHRQCIENSPHWGNAVLAREAAGRARWVPAVCLTPDGEPEDHSLEATLARAFNNDLRIAWISPRDHYYSPQPWCSGKLYGACSDARLPLLVDYRSITLDEIEEILTAFSQLRLILTQAPRFG